MADSIDIDASEFGQLASDLTAAGSGIAGKVRPVVVRGAVNVKNRLRADMRASTHFRGAANDIDFSMTSQRVFGVGVIEAEIGPRSGPGQPGAIANVAYFGTSRGGGTVPDPQTALDAEAAGFEQALAAALEGLL
jgi:hypothetical protein